ncbi:hypothetical protein, partial [Maribellus sediminis]|uniref:hypothetical protein n=1 Tax=Maribellus sediminis TaxID=2696285 RepID=UPI00197E7888
CIFILKLMKGSFLLSVIMLNLLTNYGELCNRHTVHIAGRGSVVPRWRRFVICAIAESNTIITITSTYE